MLALEITDEMELPPELEQNLLRHRLHLAQLVQGLRSMGMDEAAIEAGVSVVIASYREELLRTLKRMSK